MSASVKQRLLESFRGESLRAQLVRGALGVGGLRLLYLPLTLVTSIILARGLEPEGYGQYSFVMAVISIMALPFGSGLGQLVTREVAKFHHSEEWELLHGLLRRAQQWVVLGSSVIVSVSMLIAAQNAAWSVRDRWTLLFIGSLLLPILGLNVLRSATLRGLQHVFSAQIPEMLARPILHLVIVGSMLMVGLLNPVNAIASQIAATAFALGVGTWLLGRLRPTEVNLARPNYLHRQWVQALFPFTLLAAVSTFNGQIGILTLGWLGSVEEVAALQVAMSGAVLVAFSLNIVNMVIGPHITRAHRDNDKHRLHHLSRLSARAALAVALPIAMTLTLFGGPIVELLYGVYGDLNYVSASNPDHVIRHWRSGDYTRQKLKRGWMPPHPTLFVRREVLARHGDYDTSYQIAADYDAMLRWLWKGNIHVAYVPEVLVYMRVGGESNRSLGRIVRKSFEDYQALRTNGVGGIGALTWKNVSKIPQFMKK